MVAEAIAPAAIANVLRVIMTVVVRLAQRQSRRTESSINILAMPFRYSSRADENPAPSFGPGHETHANVKFAKFADRRIGLVALAHRDNGKIPCASRS
jgi:hypothetical protein